MWFKCFLVCIYMHFIQKLTEINFNIFLYSFAFFSIYLEQDECCPVICCRWFTHQQKVAHYIKYTVDGWSTTFPVGEQFCFTLLKTKKFRILTKVCKFCLGLTMIMKFRPSLWRLTLRMYYQIYLLKQDEPEVEWDLSFKSRQFGYVYPCWIWPCHHFCFSCCSSPMTTSFRVRYCTLWIIVLGGRGPQQQQQQLLDVGHMMRYGY